MWSCSATIAAFSEAGTWTVDYVGPTDQVNNWVRYEETDLANLGFPTQLLVTYDGGSPP